MNDADSDQANLLIERLNIRLPGGFDKRADSIARQVGKQMHRLGFHNTRDLSLDQLSIGGVKTAAGETDGVIARRIAQAVQSRINDAGRSQTDSRAQVSSGPGEEDQNAG